MASLLSWGKKRLEGAVAQANPWDKGKTYSTVVNNRTPTPNAPQVDNRANDARIRALHQQAKSGQVPRHVAAAQINATANNNPVTAKEVIDPRSAYQKVGLGIAEMLSSRKVAPVALGLGRSGMGTIESVSGLVDLASPGKGNSRVTKSLQKQSKLTDTVVDQERYSKVGYKGAQLGGDLITFAAGGKPITKAVSTASKALPKVKAVTKAADKIARGSKAGNVAVRSARYLKRPEIASDIIADATLSTGLRSAKGQDVSPTTVATDLAISSGVALGLGATGKAARKLIPALDAPAPTPKQAATAVKKATTNPAVAELQVSRRRLQRQWDVASVPQRKQIEKAIAAVDNEIRNITQGGYAKVPGTPDKTPSRKQLPLQGAKGFDSPASLSKTGNTSSDISLPSRSQSPLRASMTEDEFFQRYKPELTNKVAIPPYRISQEPAATPNAYRADSSVPSVKPTKQTPKLAQTQVQSKTPQIDPYNNNTPKLTSRTDLVDSSTGHPGRPTQIKKVLAAEQFPRTTKETTPPPKLPSSISPADNLLPNDLKVKKTTGLDKAFRSTRSIIERQGKTGKELAADLQKSRDIEEIYQADVLGRMPTVTKLKSKEFEAFVDAVEGLEKPANPKIAQAVDEWRTIAPEIRQRAENAGIDVGDLGPTYFPHFVDYDKLFNNRNDLNVAINHIIRSGQAESPEAALELLNQARDVSRNRRMGNLEAARIVNVPIYDKTKNAITSYISGSTRRIAQAETFGPKDEIALQKLTQIAREGGDTAAATEAFNIAVGAKKYGPSSEKISNTARSYLSTTRLGLGAITNSSQSVNTGIVTGHIRTMGAMLKQLDPEQRKFVESTGVVADSVINDIKEATGFSGKVLSKITAPGFGKVEKFNRSVAAVAGRDYARNLLKKGDTKTLTEKLDVTGKIGKKLTEAQEIQAARKIVEKTQFKVDAQDLPGWVSSPAGKLVAQFRTFSYNQSKFFSNEIIKPTAKGDFLPMARLLAALPLGFTIYETKRLANNREETDGKGRKVLEAFGSVGGAGLALDVFKSMVPLNGKYLDSGRRVSMAVGTFGGPTASTATDLVGSLSDAVQKKNIPKDNPNLEGKVGIKQGEEYFDATQLSRFGLRQIPIVGTRLQNTFLPYTNKKQDKKFSKSDSSSSVDDKESIKIAAFGSDKGKAYLALKDENQKKEWARNDPEFRALYEQEKAFNKAFGSSRLLPDGLTPEEQKVINSYDRRASEGNKQLFARNPEAKKQYEKAHLRERLLAGEITEESYNKSLAKIDGEETPKARKKAKTTRTKSSRTRARKVTSRKGRKGGSKQIPMALINKAITAPKMGKIRTAKLSVKAPSAPTFKKPRKAIPKVDKTPTKLAVRKTNQG